LWLVGFAAVLDLPNVAACSCLAFEPIATMANATEATAPPRVYAERVAFTDDHRSGFPMSSQALAWISRRRIG
jgi:hypothetical protein